MTTPILDDFWTYSLPLRPTAVNSSMAIPTEQRKTGDTQNRISLPSGMHTIILLWQGNATSINVQLADGSTNGRPLAVLPGGASAKQVMVPVVVPTGGYELFLVQNLAVSTEQSTTPPRSVGVTLIMNRTKDATQ